MSDRPNWRQPHLSDAELNDLDQVFADLEFTDVDEPKADALNPIYPQLGNSVIGDSVDPSITTVSNLEVESLIPSTQRNFFDVLEVNNIGSMNPRKL